MDDSVAGNERRSGCPIASSLDILGDKWTLVIIRDLVNGKRRYAEFLNSPEGITTSVLASRLKRMEAQGLIRSALYEQHPKRYDYELTPMGWALLPVLQELCRWGNRWIAETWVPPASFMDRKVQD